ncbi:uncharacterized protein LOC111896601 isoform X2 [Lactuca sativa]|uniref:uncharacterized protein LOC111896601 isoform X2 n=1 Tax=Lactuca sativa TaxID=4236 RepID=UPI000CD9E8C9|nr:uncharacterized protein LOC111896601 isoform X2 [Lactuca sativa]
MLIMKSDEVKEKNTMKESPKRYTNPFLSDEENEKVNNNNHQEVYTDKNVMELELECELPELLVCYNDGGFHVKDICVDDGIPHDKHDDIINQSLIFSPMEDYYMEESNHVVDIGDNLDISVEDLQNSTPDKDCEDDDDDDDDDAKECGTKEEEDIESIDPNEIKNISKDDNHVISECAPEELKCAESDTVPKGIDNYVPENQQMDLNSVFLDDKDKDKDKDKDEDRPLPSLKSLLESINGVDDKDQHPSQSCVEGNEGEEEVSTSIEGNNTLNLTNGKTVISNGLHDVHERGEGESSFSVAGPVSGRINYSGQIAFSGSISLRSDSSTTSTRSFAFPILQTEWNSSPVRMAKADRRRLQKHRGWRNGLLCCRF